MTLRAFRKIQVSNPEDTPGTAEEAAELCKGTLSWASGEIFEMPEDDRNSLARYHEDWDIVGEEAALSWQGDLNFRHILWAIAMAIRGNVSPTQPDSSNEPNTYKWTYAPAETTANTPDIANGIDTFTFEFGDNTQAYEAEYCFATRLEISGAPNELCQFAVDIVGRQVTDTTFTAGLTMQSVQYAPFNLAKIYIDDSDSFSGAPTQKTGLLRGFTWVLETQFSAFVTADGNLYFGSVVEDRKHPQLSLTYKWGSDADGERTKYEGQTTRYIRLELNGDTELDSGQSNPPKLQIDAAYRYSEWPEWGEDEGATVFDVTALGVMDSSFAKICELSLYNNVSAWPTT